MSDENDSVIENGTLTECTEKEEQLLSVVAEKIPRNATALLPIEEYVLEVTEDVDWCDAVVEAVRGGIAYKDGNGTSSREAAMFVVQAYYDQWKEYAEKIYGEVYEIKVLTDGSCLSRDERADRIAAALDHKKLMAVLEKLITELTYRTVLLAYVRYADEEEMERFTARIKSWSNGKARERYWAQSATQALFLSDTLAAMLCLEKAGLLERYAKIRGGDAQDRLDMVTLPDVGFDADDVKRYDIGNAVVEVTVTDKLELQLRQGGKVLRSFPKKGGDAAKLTACAEDFAQLKKISKDFFISRTEVMRKLYISGRTVSENAWRNAYMTHPLLKAVAKLLIWEDEAGVRFMVTETGAETVNGAAHPVAGKLRLAHVLDMPPAEIEAWQSYLVAHQKMLLVEQVWEPVMQDSASVKKRYVGRVISNRDRNAMKKALKMKGIEVSSENDGSEYDYTAGRYRFSDSGKMIFGQYFTIAYTVDPESREVTFGKGKLSEKTNARALNAIVFELDKATLRGAIMTDAADRLTPEMLKAFTAAQIREFADLAIQSGSVNCTAVLLDYKRTHFAAFDPMEAFTLD